MKEEKSFVSITDPVVNLLRLSTQKTGYNPMAEPESLRSVADIISKLAHQADELRKQRNRFMLAAEVILFIPPVVQILYALFWRP